MDELRLKATLVDFAAVDRYAEKTWLIQIEPMLKRTSNCGHRNLNQGMRQVNLANETNREKERAWLLARLAYLLYIVGRCLEQEPPDCR